jgi:hypothetical protein
MIDESAFGILISYFNLEDDEYAGERADFVERYGLFSRLLEERLTNAPPAAAARALDLGHGMYVELLEGEQELDLIAWLRQTRATLAEAGFQTAAALTFGSAWIDESEPRPAVVALGKIKLVRASLPSEPLRRALLAEAATHADDEAGSTAWGAGLYLDVEAVEALGRKPKNSPTILRSGGVAFYRGGS